MRILLIDDDQKLTRLVVKGLEEERFIVDVARTGGSGDGMASVNHVLMGRSSPTAEQESGRDTEAR